MFRWTDDMIRYMADAGRQTDFHRRLTAELLPYLSSQDRVCDAGCGLGFLSLALAPHVRHVTAAEYRAAAEYMENCGIVDGFVQERTSAREEYTPAFDLTGV